MATTKPPQRKETAGKAPRLDVQRDERAKRRVDEAKRKREEAAAAAAAAAADAAAAAKPAAKRKRKKVYSQTRKKAHAAQGGIKKPHLYRPGTVALR